VPYKCIVFFLSFIFHAIRIKVGVVLVLDLPVSLVNEDGDSLSGVEVK